MSTYSVYADSVDGDVQTFPSQYIKTIADDDKIVLKTKNQDYNIENQYEELYVVLGKIGKSLVNQDLKNFLRYALYEMSKNGDIIKG